MAGTFRGFTSYFTGAVLAAASAARSAVPLQPKISPAAPVLHSARTASSLAQLLILVFFLIVLFIFLVSLLVAIRRIILRGRAVSHEKTEHVDAWSLAGRRIKTPPESEVPDEEDE